MTPIEEGKAIASKRRDAWKNSLGHLEHRKATFLHISAVANIFLLLTYGQRDLS